MSLFGHLAAGRERKRDALIAAFAAQPCRDCGAAPRQRCDLSVIAEAVRIDRRPDQLVLHSSRIADAVSAGAADMGLTAAQFAGGLPTALTKGSGS
jgi:hypothetical protein